MSKHGMLPWHSLDAELGTFPPIYLSNPNSKDNRGYDGQNYNLSSNTKDTDNLIENSFKYEYDVKEIIKEIKEGKKLISYEIVEDDPRDGATWGMVSHNLKDLEFSILPIILVAYRFDDVDLFRKW